MAAGPWPRAASVAVLDQREVVGEVATTNEHAAGRPNPPPCHWSRGVPHLRSLKVPSRLDSGRGSPARNEPPEDAKPDLRATHPEEVFMVCEDHWQEIRALHHDDHVPIAEIARGYVWRPSRPGMGSDSTGTRPSPMPPSERWRPPPQVHQARGPQGGAATCPFGRVPAGDGAGDGERPLQSFLGPSWPQMTSASTGANPWRRLVFPCGSTSSRFGRQLGPIRLKVRCSTD